MIPRPTYQETRSDGRMSQRIRQGGTDCFYPDHPLYASVMLCDAQRRRDTRDVSKWLKRVLEAKTAALRATHGGG